MNLRKCDASLEFNEADHTLKMEVTPRDKKGDKTVSKLTNLSGGERSYVTVAFLLSLWACVDHPFYFLDEYDVFTVSTWHLIWSIVQATERNDQKSFSLCGFPKITLSNIQQDEINRNYMTKLLLREANMKSMHQYAFLTPQSISEITATPDLSILR